MNTSIFWIICIVMFAVGLFANVVSFFLEKKYKNKMNTIADYKKAEK